MKNLLPFLFLFFFLCSANNYAQSNYDKEREKSVSEKESKIKKTDFNETVAKTNILESVIDPEKYFVGPGDRFMISIWGQVNESFASIVSPEGIMVIPSVKEIDVRNLSLSQAKQKIRQEMSKAYVNADVSVNLLALRAFRVSVSGLTMANTSVVVSPVDRVSDALREAGGMADTLKSSQRNIQIRNADGHLRRADLIKRNNTGDLDSDPTLSNGDFIYVPPVYAWIHVFGAVNIPGRYEYVEGEKISDIIDLCAGLKFGADTSEVEIVRFVGDTTKKTQTLTMDLTELRAHKDDVSKNIPLKPDDRIFFKQKPKFHEKKNVVIHGEVVHPGTYAIIEGETTISKVIAEAGGFLPEASLGSIMVYRDIQLQGKDREFERLRLTPITDMNNIEKAYYKAKTQQYYPTVQTDFLKLFKKDGTVDNKYDFFLMGNDSVDVEKAKKTVTVIGGVVSPGIIDLRPNAGYKYYIDKTGGFTKKAKSGDVRIIKGQNRRWLDAEDKISIDDGDIIFIPEKEPVDGWKIFRDTLATAGQLAAIVSTVFVIIFYIKQTKN